MCFLNEISLNDNHAYIISQKVLQFDSGTVPTSKYLISKTDDPTRVLAEYLLSKYFNVNFINNGTHTYFRFLRTWSITVGCYRNIMTYSAWNNLNLTYYVGKLIGFFPFAGNYKNLSFLYSLVVWISLGFTSFLMNTEISNNSSKIPPAQRLLKCIILFETYVNSTVSAINVALSACRSKRFFKILDSFYQFDKFTLQMQCPSNHEAQQFYLVFVLFVGTYHVSVMTFFLHNSFFVIFMWSLVCLLTMIAVSQYIICIRMLSDRYKLANIVFENSISHQTTTEKCLYPTEIHNLFIKLRNLTEEVKTYYGFHALLIIIESVLLIASNLTKLAFNYTNNIDTLFAYNKLLLVFCILKMIFIFFIVREAHNTIKESKRTVLIAHDVLRTTTNSWIIKEFEVFILNCWNNPIIFDVYDFFNLDYKLLQSIIASIVTYLVVLVQIQLAITSQ